MSVKVVEEKVWEGALRAQSLGRDGEMASGQEWSLIGANPAQQPIPDKVIYT